MKKATDKIETLTIDVSETKKLNAAMQAELKKIHELILNNKVSASVK